MVNDITNPKKEDIIEKRPVWLKKVKLKNGKWYFAAIHRFGGCLSNSNGDYWLMSEITPDGKYVANVGDNVVANKDTVVEEEDATLCSMFVTKDNDRYIVSPDEEGNYYLNREHIVGVLASSYVEPKKENKLVAIAPNKVNDDYEGRLLHIRLRRRINGREVAIDSAITQEAIERFGEEVITLSVKKMYKAIQKAGEELHKDTAICITG